MKSHFDLGVEHFKAGRFQQAVESLKKSEGHGRPIEAKSYLALAYIKLKQWKEAEQIYNDVLSYCSRDPSRFSGTISVGHRNLGHVYLDHSCEVKSSDERNTLREKARQNYNKAQWPDVYVNLLDYLDLSQEERKSQSESVFEKILLNGIENDEEKPLFQALIYNAKADYDNAVISFEKVLANDCLSNLTKSNRGVYASVYILKMITGEGFSRYQLLKPEKLITKATKDCFLAMVDDISDPHLRCRFLLQALSTHTMLGRIFHVKTDTIGKSPSIERGRLKTVVEMLSKEKNLLIDESTRKMLDADQALKAQLRNHAPELFKSLYPENLPANGYNPTLLPNKQATKFAQMTEQELAKRAANDKESEGLRFIGNDDL